METCIYYHICIYKNGVINSFLDQELMQQHKSAPVTVNKVPNIFDKQL